MYIKKGQKMPWIEQKEYPARPFGYSERQTGESTLPAGTRLFHGSYWKLDGFAPAYTCFTPENKAYKEGLGISGYTYMAVLKKSVPAEWYGDNEVRIEISPENADIYYLGTVREGKVLYIPTRNANQYTPIRKKIHSYSPEFQEIAGKLNEFESWKVRDRYLGNRRIAGYVPT